METTLVLNEQQVDTLKWLLELYGQEAYGTTTTAKVLTQILDKILEAQQ